MLTLRIRDHQGKVVKEIPLADGAHSIGRSPENAVVLKDSSLAREHAEWIIQANSCLIRDVGGGVLYNNEKVTEAELKPGDIVVLGRLSCEICWDEGKGSKMGEDQLGQLAIIYPKEMSGILFLEKNEMTMGRVPECDIQVMDKQASRQHAKISLREHVYVLDDLQSANGTWINGKRVTTHLLCVGDVIQIGALQYRFSLCAKNVSEALKRTSAISQVAVIAAAHKAKKEAANRYLKLVLGGVLLVAAIVAVWLWMQHK
jgi:pSer/pThr/pTyr-binding forkhead associated (FHA) protein